MKATFLTLATIFTIAPTVVLAWDKMEYAELKELSTEDQVHRFCTVYSAFFNSDSGAKRDRAKADLYLKAGFIPKEPFRENAAKQREQATSAGEEVLRVYKLLDTKKTEIICKCTSDTGTAACAKPAAALVEEVRGSIR